VELCRDEGVGAMPDGVDFVWVFMDGGNIVS
jgi:hypothetical protein